MLSELHPPPGPAGPRDLGLCLFLSRGLEASLWQVEKTGEGVYSFPPNALSFGAWPAWVEHVLPKVGRAPLPRGEFCKLTSGEGAEGRGEKRPEQLSLHRSGLSLGEVLWGNASERWLLAGAVRPKLGPVESCPEGRRALLQGSGASKVGDSARGWENSRGCGSRVCRSLKEKARLQWVKTQVREGRWRIGRIVVTGVGDS